MQHAHPGQLSLTPMKLEQNAAKMENLFSEVTIDILLIVLMAAEVLEIQGKIGRDSQPTTYPEHGPLANL